jgi:hypothetical protein
VTEKESIHLMFIMSVDRGEKVEASGGQGIDSQCSIMDRSFTFLYEVEILINSSVADWQWLGWIVS